MPMHFVQNHIKSRRFTVTPNSPDRSSRNVQYGSLYISLLSALKAVKRYLKPPSAVLKSRATLKHVNEFLKREKTGSFVLNLGSGSTFYGSHVINLNICARPNVNVVGDAHLLPFRSHSLDAVFCQAVLEHVPQPAVVVAEIWRVLTNGGKVYVDVPFTHPYHDVVDFQRFTKDGLGELFKEFEIIDLDVSVGPATAMIQQVQWTFAALLSFNNRRLFFAWKMLLGWALFPLRYLNWFLEGNSFATDCATAYRLAARKTSSPTNPRYLEKKWT